MSIYRLDVPLYFDDEEQVMAVVKLLRNKAARVKREILNRDYFRMFEDFADEIEDEWVRQKRKATL